jgi:hypothetical protein
MTLRRTLAAALLALLATAATACGGQDTPPDTGTGTLDTVPTTPAGPPPTAVQTPTPGGNGATTTPPQQPVEVMPASWKSCQNPLRGSSIGYPGDWFTTSLNPSQACSLFHPTAFTIPANSEIPRVAMNAFQTQDSAATYRAQATDPQFSTVVLNESTTVAGRAAYRYEVVSKGLGLDEAGTREYGYIVDNGGKAFVLYTVARATETRYNDWKFIIDTAKGTLRFDH